MTDASEKNAVTELQEFLGVGERVEAVVFGHWGWHGGFDSPGYGEPSPAPVPHDKRGVVLTWRQAKKYMTAWSFYGGFGAPKAYAVRIWTNRRIIWVTQYDGSTGLDSSMRHPTAHIPDMPGG